MATAAATVHVDQATHERFIRRAIALAGQAVEKGNHPFGALLVRHEAKESVVVLEAENEVHTCHDVTMHAEQNLISQASRKLTREQFSNLYLYTSTEPCCMCAGATYWSGGVSHVVYACSEQKLGEICSHSKDAITRSIGMDIPCRDVFARAHKRPDGSPAVHVIGPILEDEAAAQHVKFW